MYLCDSKHEEVCYEGRYCPVCDARDEIKDLERKIEELEADIRKLENS
jgi:hypothetical protein